MSINKEHLAAIDFAFGQTMELIKGNPAQILEEQNKSLVDLVRHSVKLKFWKDRILIKPEEISIENLSENIPVLTRQTIQTNAGQLRLRIPNTPRSSYFTTKTSGSTGKPVEIMKFGPSQSIQTSVLTLLRREWAGLDVSKNYVRIRAGREEAINPNWGFPYSLLGKNGTSSTLNISERLTQGILDYLIENDASYVHGNTTILRNLALEARNSDKTNQLNLLLALTWAEKVNEDDRELIRQHLGVEIWDSYSSEELGLIALQCPSGVHLHSIPFFTHLEIVDENDNPCPIGKVGRVLATSLHNFAQPLIRYELGDLASFQEPCQQFPGLPVINPVVTRTRDVYMSKDGQKLYPRFGKCKFLSYKGLSDFQVVLCSDSLLFLYSSQKSLTESQEREVQGDIGAQFANDFTVELRRVESRNLSSEWKRKVFYRYDGLASDLVAAEESGLSDLLKGA